MSTAVATFSGHEHPGDLTLVCCLLSCPQRVSQNHPPVHGGHVSALPPWSSPRKATGHVEDKTLCLREWGAMALFGQGGNPGSESLSRSNQAWEEAQRLLFRVLQAGGGYRMHFVSVSPDSLSRESKHFLLCFFYFFLLGLSLFLSPETSFFYRQQILRQ